MDKDGFPINALFKHVGCFNLFHQQYDLMTRDKPRPTNFEMHNTKTTWKELQVEMPRMLPECGGAIIVE